MKIALCLFGNVGHTLPQGVRKKQEGHDPFKEAFKSKGQWTNPTHAYKAFEKHIFSVVDYETDIFIHSWSTDFKEELLQMYKPKKYEIVEQTQFGSDPAKYGLIGTDMNKWNLPESTMKSYEFLLPSRGSVQAIIDEMVELNFRVESRWWSNKRVLELAKDQENEDGFEYDFIVVARFDNRFRKPIPFAELDPTKFYGSKRDGRIDENYAYFDYWFVSGSKNMNQFATLYDKRYNYSIRPTFACREHVVKTIGPNAIKFLFKNNTDYTLIRG